MASMRTPNRWRRIVVVVVWLAVLAATVVTVPAASQAQVLPRAAFDWTMPKRTVVDGNGRAVYRTTTAQIAPDDFTVEFDACTSSVTGAATYTWQVENRPVQQTSSCTISMQLGEGTHRVRLSVTDSTGSSVPVQREVVVQDWLVVAFGDSYGAGEGAPDTPLNPGVLAGLEAQWANFAAAWANVETKAQGVVDALNNYQATEAKFATFEAAWAAWTANPTNATLTGAVLAAAADLGITAFTEVTTNLWNAAVAAVDTAKALWEAAVAAYDTAVVAVNAITTTIDSIKAGLSADWQDRLCHRSGNSGAFQAARALEDLDPRTSVTLVHLACTGATILEGIIGRYDGSESEPSVHVPGGLDPQPVAATALVNGREVDAIYASIGGNDAQFANIVKACMVQPHCYDDTRDPFPGVVDVVAHWNSTVMSLCQPFRLAITVLPMTGWGECVRLMRQAVITLPELATKTAKEIFEIGLNGGTFDDAAQIPLAQRYDLMDDFIFNNEDVSLLRPTRRNRLYISEYPDLTRDQNGGYCDGAVHGLDAIPGWSFAETQWADTFLTPALNNAIAASAQAQGWTLITGVAAGYRDKGYCSTGRFIVRLQESLVNQALIDGAVHPNAVGFSVYGAQIVQALLVDFYPVAGPTLGRDLTQPRRPDQVPVAEAGPDRNLVEGSAVVLTNSTWDGDGDSLRYEWTHNAPPTVAALRPNAQLAAPELAAFDNGTVTVTVRTADEDTDYWATNPLPSDTATVTITNAAPSVGAITAPVVPVPVNQAINVTSSFTDPGVADAPFRASWAFGDGSSVTCASSAPTATCTLSDTGGAGTTTATHTYTTPGIYTVSLSVADKDGGTGMAPPFQYVVVYDSDGPFVTGAGQIWSPPGAYPAQPSAEGVAKFGFQSRYMKGATVPTGKTDFSFEAVGFEFRSLQYQWLVVSGSRATYKGTGTVNGHAGYGFLLAAVDGDRDNTKKGDRVRLHVWDLATGDTVYDNLHGAAIDTDIRNHDVTHLTVGQVVIHESKGR